MRKSSSSSFPRLFQRTDVLLHVGPVAGIFGSERQILVEVFARRPLVAGLHVMHTQALIGRRELRRELLGRLKRLQRLLRVVLLVATDIGFAQIVITGGRVVAAQVGVFHYEDDALIAILAQVLAQRLDPNRLHHLVIVFHAHAPAALLLGGQLLERVNALD